MDSRSAAACVTIRKSLYCEEIGIRARRTWRYQACSAASCPMYSDRKSTRLNSSHQIISYAVFCLKKKKIRIQSKFELNSLNVFSATRRQKHNTKTIPRVMLTRAKISALNCVVDIALHRPLHS